MNLDNLEPQEFVLTPEEHKFFLEILDRPPAPPSEYAIRAIKEYRKAIRNGILTVVTDTLPIDGKSSEPRRAC